MQSQAQYVWKFEYVLNNASSKWRHLASGDTTAIASFKFSRTDENDTTTYYLKGFRLWPITNSSTEWFIDELRLYMDRGDEKFSLDDSLISYGLELELQIDPLRGLPVQSDSVNSVSFDFGGDSLLIVDVDKQMMFVVAVVHNWRDENPENLEIDTTATGPYGKWFSIKVFKEDITVSPDVHNIITIPDSAEKFFYQALNLPVTIRNGFASSAEDDSTRLNMFYPTFRPINGTTASKNQRIDDLSFDADVFIPVKNDSIELGIKSASFQFGFDNRILEYESVELGSLWNDLWGLGAGYYVITSVTQVDLFDEDHPEYTIFQYNVEINEERTAEYGTVDSSSIIRLKFNVVGPGISPIFIQNIDIRDRWGIQYHTYQHLQNYANVEAGGNSERYDAWAKYILGDFTYSGGAEISTAGIGDARVSWEDVSLFANYLWLSSASANWYKRFDIGSPDSPIPSVLSLDDTTNFYDLMILGINYQRSISGVFNQKITTRETCQLEIYQENENLSSDLSIIRVFMKNVQDMASAHLCWRFNSTQLQVQSITAGDWVRNTTETQLMLVPDGLLSKGIIDLNFVALSNSLNGEGQFVEIALRKKTTIDMELFLEEIDVRNSQGKQIEVRYFSGGDDLIVPEEYFLLNNYPNPFNASTKIAYSIAADKPGNYIVDIRDILGNTIITLENRYHRSGKYVLYWNGKNQLDQPVSSGMYFLKLHGKSVNKTKKIMLLR
ncbi:MAG: T9SS type A sorting domain-containing protein [Candidatus Marinimicrobia bacterium]|nr:T9SS type A sorting domain-containing protein [Candidatus Neomarinimicrobiota bacterium]